MKSYDSESLDLSIDKSKKTIVIRLEESFASYLLGLGNKWCDDLLKGMLNRFQDSNIVVLCRYEPQLSKILENYGDKFIVPKEVVIGFNLLKNTDLFIGMGGTMTADICISRQRYFCRRLSDKKETNSEAPYYKGHIGKY